MCKRYLDLSAAFPTGGTIKHPKYKSYQDPTGVVKGKLNLANANTNKHQANGEVIVAAAHWTAGHWLNPWDDYDFCVIRDTDGKAVVLRCVPKGKKPQHLLGRNTGSAGFSWCAKGPTHVTPEMMEIMAKLIAEYCHFHGKSPDQMMSIPDGHYKEGHGMVWTGKTNQVPFLTDHARIAVLDNYASYRWDVGGELPNVKGVPDKKNLMEPLRRKVRWYMSKIAFDPKTKKPQYEFNAIL